MKPLHFLPLTAIVTASFNRQQSFLEKIEPIDKTLSAITCALVSWLWSWFQEPGYDHMLFFLRILSVPPAVVLKKPGSCCMLTAYRGFWIFLLGAKQCDWVTATGKWSKTWILIWSCVLRDEDQFFHVPFKPEIWKTEHLCSVVAVGVSYLSLKMLH